jgi:hypothetical protein
MEDHADFRDHPAESRPNRLRSLGLRATCITFALVAFAYLFRLATPVFWNDESDTGVLARNVRQAGLPVAYDGRNAVTFEGCSQLGEGLLSKKLPWLQYYVGAASQVVFGDTTGGTRALFALVGLAAFFPLLGLLRGRSGIRCCSPHF